MRKLLCPSSPPTKTETGWPCTSKQDKKEKTESSSMDFIAQAN
jgi:hypothetical protein